MITRVKKLFLLLICGTAVFANGNLKDVAYGTNAESLDLYDGDSQKVSESDVDTAVRLNANKTYAPSITFLMHGMGGNASHWANTLECSYGADGDISWSGSEDFDPEADGIIKSIKEKGIDVSAKTDVYLAKAHTSTPFCFELEKYDYEESNFVNVKKIADYTVHNVVVFNSSNGSQNFDREYYEFKRVVNSISYDYKQSMLFVPKLNLVAHSRGGLVITKYANEYPYNVDSIFCLGTPFKGTTFASSVQDLGNFLSNHFGVNELTDWFNNSYNCPAYEDIQKVEYQENLENRWNGFTKNYVKGYAIGSCMSISLITSILARSKGDSRVQNFSQWIDWIIYLLDAIDNACKMPSLLVNEEEYEKRLDRPIEYGSFNDVGNLFSNIFQASIISAIKSTLKELVYDLGIGEVIDDTSTVLNSLGTIFLISGHPVASAICYLFNGLIKAVENNLLTDLAKLIAPFFTSYNGYFGIVRGDLFVDLDSEMCDYDEFNRYIVILTEDSLNASRGRTTVKDLPIGHNLESRNEKIIDLILEKATLGNFGNISFKDAYNEDELFAKEYGVSVIKSDQINFYMYSNLKRKIINPHIVIQDRQSDLNLYLKEVKVEGGNRGAYANDPFIEYVGSNNFRLNIHYEGECSFKYASGHVRTYLNDIPAFKLDNVDVNLINESGDCSSLYIEGANGENGTNGSKGADGLSGSDGSNGTNGKNGTDGTHAKNGCDALRCRRLDVTKAREVTLKGGNGGNGGNGGSGGNGGRGGHAVKKNAGHGGDGGNGGNGGCGGYCGLPFKAVLVERSGYNKNNRSGLGNFFTCGQIGVGGTGGSGGNGGDGGNSSGSTGILWWTTYYNGGNGGRGGLVGRGGNCYQDDTYYNKYKNYFDFPEVTGALCGAKYGNGGNGGTGGDSDAHGGYGGSAVNGSQDDGRIDSRTLYETVNGVRAFALNGYGVNNFNQRTKSTKTPTFGKNGINRY